MAYVSDGACSSLAVVLGDWVDFGVIVGILLLKAFVGFYQEKQVAGVMASLKGA